MCAPRFPHLCIQPKRRSEELIRTTRGWASLENGHLCILWQLPEQWAINGATYKGGVVILRLGSNGPHAWITYSLGRDPSESARSIVRKAAESHPAARWAREHKDWLCEALASLHLCTMSLGLRGAYLDADAVRNGENYAPDFLAYARDMQESLFRAARWIEAVASVALFMRLEQSSCDRLVSPCDACERPAHPMETCEEAADDASLACDPEA